MPFQSKQHTPVDLGDLGVVEDGGLASLRLAPILSTLPADQVLHDAAVVRAAREILHEHLPPALLDPFAPAEQRNQHVKEVLRAAMSHDRQVGGVLAGVPDDARAFQHLFAATVGWGPAQPYLDDPRVQEVQIIREAIRVQEVGQPFVTVPERFRSVAEVKQRAVLVASKMNSKLDSANPQATIPLAHGTRMHVSIAPIIAHDGVLVCIRRGRTTAWDLHDILARRTLNAEVVDLLQLLCRARCSFLIAGHTGSGKTALLEALANTWPGDPHILTIEDHTLEIVIRRALTWTRELVDTSKDPLAFGKAAREALRQTPNLVTPGETRGAEAGAILSLVTSDHPVITTIHARTCADAAARFARCATLPGSYMYEGRFHDALVDTCSGFDVVITIESWDTLGVRLVTEIALLDGVQAAPGGLRPVTIPLVQLQVDPDGALRWICHARATTNGTLAWVDGSERTPVTLVDKLRRVAAQAAVRLNTSLTVLTSALSRAEDLILSGETERALATLMQAWPLRMDERLARMGQRAITLTPHIFTPLMQRASAAIAEMTTLIQQREWHTAQAHLATLLAQADLAIAAMPVDGWHGLQHQIAAGVGQMALADTALQDTQTALANGDLHTARHLVESIPLAGLPDTYVAPVLDCKVQVHTQLVQRGEGSAQVLETLTTQLRALRPAGVPGTGDGTSPVPAACDPGARAMGEPS